MPQVAECRGDRHQGREVGRIGERQRLFGGESRARRCPVENCGEPYHPVLQALGRILLAEANLRVQPGDRIGLVGRNGAGKTTTLKVLAGEGSPYAGAVERRGAVGYLPQDPRTGDLSHTARDRVLSARGLDTLLSEMKALEAKMATDASDALVRRYGALEDRFAGLGGYAAEAEAARICANLGLPDRVLAQTIGTLSG